MCKGESPDQVTIKRNVKPELERRSVRFYGQPFLPASKDREKLNRVYFRVKKKGRSGYNREKREN